VACGARGASRSGSPLASIPDEPIKSEFNSPIAGLTNIRPDGSSTSWWPRSQPRDKPEEKEKWVPRSCHGMGGPLDRSAINFQPTGGGKAAITGDFVLIGTEVNDVVRALRSNGIDVTAIHNHMLTEEPRIIFMHFWANDDAIKLAKALRAALDKTASSKS
jgi:hypothetical protein